MNILFITYQGDVSGATSSLIYLSTGLAEKGHNVFFGCRKESLIYQSLINSKVTLVAMNFRGKFDFQLIRQLKDIITENNIEIVNAQSSWDRYSSILTRWIYRLNVKIIHTRRQIPMSMGGLLQNFLYRYGTDKIIAVSNGVKQELVRLGLPANHIHVIFNGTPIEKYKNLDSKKINFLAEKYKIEDTDFVIGCVSRLKKQEQILNALMLLDRQVKVFFIGIECSPVFNSIIEKFPIPHEVFFLGNIPSNEVLNYYKIFDIHILASTMEGLSQSLLEAMALEIPVIATAAGGNIDLITNGENGLLFNDGDITALSHHINRLILNENLRKKLIQNGKKTALYEFSIDKVINNYENFFKALLIKTPKK